MTLSVRFLFQFRKGEWANIIDSIVCKLGGVLTINNKHGGKQTVPSTQRDRGEERRMSHGKEARERGAGGAQAASASRSGTEKRIQNRCRETGFSGSPPA